MTPYEPLPTASLLLRSNRSGPFFEAKFRYHGRQVKRRLGRAWMTRDPSGGWTPRRGRVGDGYLDERRAHVAAADLVRTYATDVNESDRIERDRLTQGVLFRPRRGELPKARPGSAGRARLARSR